MPPRITIITPSFQQAEFIEETIASVLSQKYENLEFFVVDGGSTDQTVEIIHRYASFIDWWVSEKDSGQSDAINKGLQRATGEIITWLNSDDILLPNALNTVADIFERNPDAWVVHGKTRLFGKGFPTTDKGAPLPCPEELYLAKLAFPQPSTFFSRAALQNTGLLDTSLHYGMDYDFFLRMYLLRGEFIATEAVLSGYRLHKSAKGIALQSQFAQEYARVFAQLLHSLPVEKKLMELALQADLPLHIVKKTYPIQRQICSEKLQLALFENALARLTFLYEALSLSEAKKLAHFLQKNAPAFCQKYPEIHQIAWRSSLPSWLIGWMRCFR
ncbi:MAG: glycosyltransferase family 2 protein [Cytophagales bacterium]|nr:glycosyltransferase [Bernardetiaceae bacterium]MDW8211265.1 glycosyltransferase family 2 protein [Cytophagales bacterium]